VTSSKKECKQLRNEKIGCDCDEPQVSFCLTSSYFVLFNSKQKLRRKNKMGININDLQPLGSSLLSGKENVLDNLRELSPEELTISGGTANQIVKKDPSDGDTTVITTITSRGCDSYYYYYND
jgi:hypothetical protein